jgi:iron-sulfur cluster repair protein YtfE (RIC family)
MALALTTNARTHTHTLRKASLDYVCCGGSHWILQKQQKEDNSSPRFKVGVAAYMQAA